MTRRILSQTDWVPAAAVLVIAAILGAQVSYAPVRTVVYIMLAVLLVALVAVRGALGAAGSRTTWLVRAAGLTVVAAELVVTAWWVRQEPYPSSIDRFVLLVWTIMLAIHLLVVGAVTARRFGVAAPVLGAGVTFGLCAFTLWALLCLMAPDIPTSNAPAVLTLALSALGVIAWSRQGDGSPGEAALAGLTAAGTVAFLTAVFIDGVLPRMSRWVSTGAPPTPALGPLAPHRLVDPVGLLMLSTLIATALLITLLSTRRHRSRVAGAAAAVA